MRGKLGPEIASTSSQASQMQEEDAHLCLVARGTALPAQAGGQEPSKVSSGKTSVNLQVLMAADGHVQQS